MRFDILIMLSMQLQSSELWCCVVWQPSTNISEEPDKKKWRLQMPLKCWCPTSHPRRMYCYNLGCCFHFLMRDLTLLTHLSMKLRLRFRSPALGSGSERSEPWLIPALAPPLELVDTVSESKLVWQLWASFTGTSLSLCSAAESNSWALKYCSHSLSNCFSVSVWHGGSGFDSSSRPSRLRDLVESCRLAKC